MTRSPRTRFIRFGELPQPVRFTACDALVDAIRSILRGWDVRDVDPEGLPAPVIRLTKTARGYRRVSCWQHTPSLARKKVRRTLVEALCGFHFELLDWYLETYPKNLYIHGAAAMFGKRLVVFPALAKAGKSMLTVHLAMRGNRVFCDDVLPIDPATLRGHALGIVPRIRPPLPRGILPAFRRFVTARKGLGRKNRLYVNLTTKELAPLGRTAPIGGIVLLTREAGAEAAITPVDPADALQRIILQNYTRKVPQPRVLEALSDVVLRSRCYQLRYARGEQAARLIERTFAPRSRKAAGKVRR